MAWELGGVIIVKLGCRVMTLDDWYNHGGATYRRLAGDARDKSFLTAVANWLIDVEIASRPELARFHRNLEHDTQAREVA